ncbi:AidA/PixA family protein [Burkholderia ambifaria]|uniref:AidA/PixA family protein n=1 Tax=Burkholderia ambifaria TaxID=152480 RepID=UPI0024460B8A|nr:AidA/PixA family protein [Burkholderia ambifaria]
MPKNLDIFKIVDVLIAFDVDEILKSNNNSLSQHPGQPTSLGNNPDTVYMITTLANAAYGYGQGTTQGQNEAKAAAICGSRPRSTT